jgi:hypothetical protein
VFAALHGWAGSYTASYWGLALASLAGATMLLRIRRQPENRAGG